MLCTSSCPGNWRFGWVVWIIVLGVGECLFLLVVNLFGFLLLIVFLGVGVVRLELALLPLSWGASGQKTTEILGVILKWPFPIMDNLSKSLVRINLFFDAFSRKPGSKRLFFLLS